jgi:hypothetical protein
MERFNTDLASVQRQAPKLTYMHGWKLEIITSFDKWYSFHFFVHHDRNSLHSFILQTSNEEGRPPHNYTAVV